MYFHHMFNSVVKIKLEQPIYQTTVKQESHSDIVCSTKIYTGYIWQLELCVLLKKYSHDFVSYL